MTSYATQQDLVDRFGEAEVIQLTDRRGALDAIDTTVVTRALADAAAVIDAYLATQYALPLTAPSPLLTQLAADLARYYLHEQGPSETVSERYRAAVARLRDLQAGRMKLDTGGADPSSTSATAAVTAPARVFSRAGLRGY